METIIVFLSTSKYKLLSFIVSNARSFWILIFQCWESEKSESYLCKFFNYAEFCMVDRIAGKNENEVARAGSGELGRIVETHFMHGSLWAAPKAAATQNSDVDIKRSFQFSFHCSELDSCRCFWVGLVDCRKQLYEHLHVFFNPTAPYQPLLATQKAQFVE